MEKIDCIIGGVELSRPEVEAFYNEQNYIVTCGGVWIIRFNKKQNRYYGEKLHSQTKLVPRRRFIAVPASHVNDLLGFKLLKEGVYGAILQENMPKVNDKVVCVDNSGRETELTRGKVYTVIATNYDDFAIDGTFLVCVENDEGDMIDYGGVKFETI